MTTFATVSLVLVAIGIYSVLAYVTARRTHEIGLLLAIGAESSDVLGLIIKTGLRLVLCGMAIGLLASLALARVIAAQLWQVSPSDRVTFSAVIVPLLATGVAACCIPAPRAARVDPLAALRYE